MLFKRICKGWMCKALSSARFKNLLVNLLTDVLNSKNLLIRLLTDLLEIDRESRGALGI